MMRRPLVGQGLLIIQASRSHSDTPHSIGLLWTSDQPDSETSSGQHTTLETDNRAPGKIRTRNPSKRAAALTVRYTPTYEQVGVHGRFYSISYFRLNVVVL